MGLSWFGPGYALRHSAAVQKRLGTDAQGTLAIDLCLKFLMELFSPHEVGRRQDAGLVWLDPSRLGLESTSGLTVLARAGVIKLDPALVIEFDGIFFGISVVLGETGCSTLTHFSG